MRRSPLARKACGGLLVVASAAPFAAVAPSVLDAHEAMQRRQAIEPASSRASVVKVPPMPDAVASPSQALKGSGDRAEERNNRRPKR